jgi:Na+/melibiose symporter-like transporter
MLGLTWGGDRLYAWTSMQVIGMLASGVLLFVVFLFAERKAAEPILPLDLFRNRTFSVGALLALLQMMVLMGFSLYLPLFFQGVLGVSPTSAGLVMTPFSLSMVLGAVLSSTAMNKLKRSRIIAIVSALVMSVGAMLIALMTPATSPFVAILFMSLAGIGTGTFFTLPMVVVQNAVPESHLGVSTAGLRYLGQLGATLGIAIVGTVVTSAVSGNLMNHLPTSIASRQALSGALAHGFAAALVFALVALLSTFFLKDKAIVAAQEELASEEVVEANELFDKELVHA